MQELQKGLSKYRAKAAGRKEGEMSAWIKGKIGCLCGKHGAYQFSVIRNYKPLGDNWIAQIITKEREEISVKAKTEQNALEKLYSKFKKRLAERKEK